MRRSPIVAILAALLLLAAACTDDDSAEPDAQPTDYAALGDSFASGGGAPPYDVKPVACARSKRGWPFVFDEASDLVDDVEMRACGGAKIDQLFGLFEKGDEYAQIPHEPDDDVGLVTLSIGGNDVGLGPAIAACATLDCSGVASSPQFTAALAGITKRLVEEVYPALRTAYPRAKLVHVGYPRATPAAGEPVQDCPWLVGPVRTAPEAIVAAVNGALQAATQQAAPLDVTFVDVTDALAGHELCTFSPWVHPLSDGPAMLHATADGYKAIGRVVAAALDP